MTPCARCAVCPAQTPNDLCRPCERAVLLALVSRNVPKRAAIRQRKMDKQYIGLSATDGRAIYLPVEALTKKRRKKLRRTNLAT